MFWVWVLCGLVVLVDGYDITVIGFLAPEMAKEFGFEKVSLGLIFSAGLVGVALGGFTGGWIGDRYGRRLTIILSCLLFGVATLAVLAAETIPQLAFCRFTIGIGLGVAMASAIAMTAEFAPKRMRGRVVSLVGACGPVGAVIPSMLTATLVPDYGWRLLVIVGGATPILLAFIIFLIMPESIRYLALRPDLRAQCTALLKRLFPDAPPVANYESGAEPNRRGASVASLFANRLGPVTLLIWLIFFVNAMAIYLTAIWLPLVLQDMGVTMEQAAQIAALAGIAGLFGGLAVVALIPRMGALLIPVLFMIAIPFLLLFSMDSLSVPLMILGVVIPGVSVCAIQVAGTTMAGILYPTVVRVTGVGWVIGVARIGAVFGPLVGSAVIALHWRPQQMFVIAAIPMFIGMVGGSALAIACYRRFGSFQLDDSDRQSSPVAMEPIANIPARELRPN